MRIQGNDLSMLKKVLALIGIIIAIPGLMGQELQHDTVAINIEVPVRVFKGNTFVNDLTKVDFEVYEDGVLQEVRAVYLIQKDKIVKQEDQSKLFTPRTTRDFILYFEIKDYLPRISEAMDFFFDKVILPGDSLRIITPLKAYNFKKESLEKIPKKLIAEQLKGKLRSDIKTGNSQYRNLMRDFHSLNKMKYPPELEDLKRQMLFQKLVEIKELSYLDNQKILQFADYLKQTAGQKHIFYFYQKEVLPQYEKLTDFEEMELIKSVSLDLNKIKQVFSDSSISIHFMFLTQTPREVLDTLSMENQAGSSNLRDQSAEIFTAFNEMALATGGLSDSSQNPVFLFKQAVAASENYYLLYYAPKNYRTDGKFRKIEIKVKTKGLRITHRAGYIAD